MPSFTTDLAGRTERDIPLTSAEALAKHERGFRFAEFNPEQGRFRLSGPRAFFRKSDPAFPLRERGFVTRW